MERNLRLTIAYDGASYHGWQRQPDLPTVQGAVEAALMRLLGHPLHLNGASRTDAGVHAVGQVANVLTTSPIPIAHIPHALDQRLPDDIGIVAATESRLDFHASRDAQAKLYRYCIFNSPRKPVSQQLAGRAWHVWFALDTDRLCDAAARMVGTHDFAGFASQGSPRENTVRTVHGIAVERSGDIVRIDVTGDGFLYNQVRNMVGTLFEIGRGRWPIERVDEILAAKDRALAGPTAPPEGLCLQWVRYDPSSEMTNEA